MRFHRILLMSLIQKATTSCALIRTLRSNDATTTRTSLKKWICVLSVLIAIVDTNLLGHPPSSEREITFRRCLFTFSTKREIRHFHVAVVKKRQRKCSKNLLHVCSSCCFACQTYFFLRSRCCRVAGS